MLFNYCFGTELSFEKQKLRGGMNDGCVCENCGCKVRPLTKGGLLRSKKLGKVLAAYFHAYISNSVTDNFVTVCISANH